MSEIPELRAQQGFLDHFFPWWSKRVNWYLYFSLLILSPILGWNYECREFPLFGVALIGK